MMFQDKSDLFRVGGGCCNPNPFKFELINCFKCGGSLAAGSAFGKCKACLDAEAEKFKQEFAKVQEQWNEKEYCQCHTYCSRCGKKKRTDK